jgi:SAM-dependent methyltransferase
MVELARRRAAGARIVQGEATDMPFEDGAFDAVVCAFGLMHVPDQPAALSEMARVLRPGGRLALCAWAGPERSPLFALAGAAIAEAGDPSVQLPPAPDFHLFADPAQADPVLKAAGFHDISHAELRLAMPLDGPEDLFDLLRRATVRIAMLIEAQSEAAREAVARAMSRKVRSWAEAHGVETAGGFRLPAPAALVAARR